MFIEFKNYYLPLKESKQKWILLKTMTGFLNSKGGTIYIGVEDKQGQVIGLELKRKEQDEFLLFLKGFIERIRPAVDLVNREEVICPLSRSQLYISQLLRTRCFGESM